MLHLSSSCSICWLIAVLSVPQKCCSCNCSAFETRRLCSTSLCSVQMRPGEHLSVGGGHVSVGYVWRGIWLNEKILGIMGILMLGCAWESQLSQLKHLTNRPFMWLFCCHLLGGLLFTVHLFQQWQCAVLQQNIPQRQTQTAADTAFWNETFWWIQSVVCSTKFVKRSLPSVCRFQESMKPEWKQPQM